MGGLTERDIRNGAFIWYWGAMSVDDLLCLAMITEVNRKARTFRIISLDDLTVQLGEYPFDEKRGSETRKSMRPFPRAKVQEFLYAQERVRTDAVAHAQRMVLKANMELDHFRSRRRELGLAPRKKRR